MYEALCITAFTLLYRRLRYHKSSTSICSLTTTFQRVSTANFPFPLSCFNRTILNLHLCIWASAYKTFTNFGCSNMHSNKYPNRWTVESGTKSKNNLSKQYSAAKPADFLLVSNQIGSRQFRRWHPNIAALRPKWFKPLLRKYSQWVLSCKTPSVQA